MALQGKAASALERGRHAYAARAWADAHAQLRRADEAEPLAPPDLALLATASYMLGRDEDWVAAHERAHHLHLEAGDAEAAARAAFWIGMSLALRGELGPAEGWLGRAQRLLDEKGADCVERGFLLIAQGHGLLSAGDAAAARAAGAEALAIARRFGDRDLFAFAALLEGQAALYETHVSDGLPLLDEAMVAVMTEDLSPVVSGIAYCGVIIACQEVFELRRAREWTAALERWWRQQPDMVAFTGRCLVHRAEILQLGGSWEDALEETRRACRRFVETRNPTAGLARYREAELLRLRGDLDGAESAYRAASRAGWEPLPGLAQLRLAQGAVDLAAATIRRATAESADPLRRAGLLPAFVEIMLAAGELEEARTASDELDALAHRYSSAMLGAIAAYEGGAVELAVGDAPRALELLRRSLDAWRKLEAPYEVARTRLLIGGACHLLDDTDACELELEAALADFVRLGALPDAARVEQLLERAPDPETHGLSPRELEVLRLLAAGKSNREVAAALVISEHTAARHVQNIFTKLRVSSRAAATAFAFEHGLV
ncbi:MAG TPA: LuxR C-terminal-related transcriptional regulator [Gaiellaceae bacterium]|nr:LuxR C-terminal-related transcriptional regulator [Gaiellaceae bacterium]